MAACEVAAALAHSGYVQVRCAGRDALLPDLLNAGDALPCVRSPLRPMIVSLYFRNLVQGRLLAVVNFLRPQASGETDAGRARAGATAG